jgi:hypothetical protein
MPSGQIGPSFFPSPLPPGAEAYLRADNPKLLELRERYSRYVKFTHSQWAPNILSGDLDLRYFRGDNAYNWQIRGGLNEIHYLLTAYYAKDYDRLGLWDQLTEDHLFGAYTFNFNGTHCISRDLLDSIIQINFLDRHIGLSRMSRATVLDIGAGYGRLAWRMVQGLPNLEHVWCADAIAESTFLCDYYLRFRGVREVARVVPVDCISGAIRGRQIDIVTNIHSFSECTLEAVLWWLNILDTASVTYLMIIPNTSDNLMTIEKDGSRLEFGSAIEGHGYRLIEKEFMFEDAPSLQKYGVHAAATVWLYRRF